ncbi:MAG: lysophospholipid acyltransferase family protein [Spirochaetota bacterium]
MTKTLAIGLYFWTLLGATSFLLVPYGLLRLLGQNAVAYRYAKAVARTWARHLLWFGRISVRIDGLEHYPRGARRVCIVGNHQGYADILLLEAHLPEVGGFVAKEELKLVPVLSTWMRIFRCVFIDRGSVRRGTRALDKAVRNIRDGYPMLIFPEGTRSHSRRVGLFKGGSLKLAVEAEATIVPVTIDGTYKALEEHRRIRPAKTRLIVHPPVSPGEYRHLRRGELAELLRKIVSAPLKS